MTSSGDDLIARVAATDVPSENLDWPALRASLKAKIETNVALFLADQNDVPAIPKPFPPQNRPLGGLKLPPFPPRKGNHVTAYEIPPARLTQDQANDFKNVVFDLIEGFSTEPPFTIQRLCELCNSPKAHYTSVGKYLRAVERSLLVTGTWQEYRPAPSELASNTNPSAQSVVTSSVIISSNPATPLFSPIPFLHDDARRSKSASPPPSPLVLSSIGPSSGGHPESLEPKVLGLVDEMDDPGPGHMSDHPKAISSVTTVSEETGARALEDRFVRPQENANEEDMDEDKENRAS